jgi:predicted DNA-binding transcriptional regulator AlpA
MSDKYLRFSQLKGAGVPHSRAVLTEMIKCGGFPKPASSRPGREPAWRLSDVVEWLKDPSSHLSDEPWLNPTKSSWVQPGR